MVVLSIETSGCQPQTIVIGRRGTYETTQIAFDLSYLVEAYGSGVAVLAVKRSQDESAYPAVVTQENNTLTWTVSETDTAYVGAGECQLMWYVEGGLAKTIIYPMVVMRDILQTAEEPPDGYENWIEHLTGLGAETQQNAQNAAQSATEAKASEESAAESAQRAEDAAGMLVDVSATATTLEPGQPATAEYDEGVFKFGIPKGDKLTYADLTEADKEDLVQGPIKAAQDAAVDAVGTAKTNAVDAVNGAGTTQVQNVNSAGSTQVNTVNQAGATQVGNVNQAGATQVQAVEDKGDEVIASIPSDYSDLTAEVDDLSRQLNDKTTGLDTKAPVILETASGAIATFTDGADSMPIKKLVAQIEPVQDLHGYDHPWPAGGGKNKFNLDATTQTSNGVTFTVNADKTISASGTASGTAVFRFYITYADLPQGESLTLNGTPSSGAWLTKYGMALCDSDGFALNNHTDSGEGCTYTPNELNSLTQFQIVVRSGINADGLVFKPMIRLASETDATFAPYENLCPISGHTGAEIEQTGVNLFDKNNANILEAYTNTKIVQSPNHRTIFIPCKPNTKYIASNSVTNRVVFGYTTAVPGFGVDVYSMDSGQTGADAKYLVLYCWNGLVDTATLQDTLNAVQIELGSTATDYEPYTGNQISVNWETEAGTVYGGTLDPISGKLTDEMIKYAFSCSDFAWRTNGEGLFYTYLSNQFILPDTLNECVISCNKYEAVAYAAKDTSKPKTYTTWNGAPAGKILYVTDGRFTTVNDFLADNEDTYIIGKRVESLEYSIASQQFTTLYGTNNIWADTGDTEVTYPCDTRLYIDNKITQAIAAALNA